MFRYIKKAFVACKLRKSKGPLEKLPLELRLYIASHANTIADIMVTVHTVYSDLNRISKTNEFKKIKSDIRKIMEEILNE